MTKLLGVSRSVQRGTSGMIEGLAACFTGLEDPRETSKCDHQLIDILVIAVCAVIACAESWEDIELYYRAHEVLTAEGSQGKLVSERSRPGSARSAFQAAQAASTTAW